MDIVKTIYNYNNRDFESDFKLYLENSELGKKLVREITAKNSNVRDKHLQLYTTDMLLISDLKVKAMRNCLNLSELYSPTSISSLRNSINIELAEKIDLVDTQPNITYCSFYKHLYFLLSNTTVELPSKVQVKITIDNGQLRTKLMYSIVNIPELSNVQVFAIITEKKEQLDKLLLLQQCLNSIKQAVNNNSIIVNENEIELELIHVSDLGAYYLMKKCFCPYCDYNSKNAVYVSSNSVDLFGISNSKFCICLMHAFMRCTEHMIFATYSIYENLEAEIRNIPGMTWFSIITKEKSYDNELLYCKCPMLTKEHCIQVCQHMLNILLKLQAENEIIDLWLKFLKLVTNLFLATSDYVKRNKCSIVKIAKEFCIQYESRISKSFTYLHILHHHLQFLLDNFDIVKLQNQAEEHQHSTCQRIIKNKTNMGGGRGEQFSTNAQAMLYSVRLVALYSTISNSSNKEQLVKLQQVYTDKQLSAKKFHTKKVENTIQTLLSKIEQHECKQKQQAQSVQAKNMTTNAIDLTYNNTNNNNTSTSNKNDSIDLTTSASNSPSNQLETQDLGLEISNLQATPIVEQATQLSEQNSEPNTNTSTYNDIHFHAPIGTVVQRNKFKPNTRRSRAEFGAKAGAEPQAKKPRSKFM